MPPGLDNPRVQTHISPSSLAANVIPGSAKHAESRGEKRTTIVSSSDQDLNFVKDTTLYRNDQNKKWADHQEKSYNTQLEIGL